MYFPSSHNSAVISTFIDVISFVYFSLCLNFVRILSLSAICVDFIKLFIFSSSMNLQTNEFQIQNLISLWRSLKCNNKKKKNQQRQNSILWYTSNDQVLSNVMMKCWNQMKKKRKKIHVSALISAIVWSEERKKKLINKNYCHLKLPTRCLLTHTRVSIWQRARGNNSSSNREKKKLKIYF